MADLIVSSQEVAEVEKRDFHSLAQVALCYTSGDREEKWHLEMELALVKEQVELAHNEALVPSTATTLPQDMAGKLTALEMALEKVVAPASGRKHGAEVGLGCKCTAAQAVG